MGDDDGAAGGRELVGNGARRFIDVDQYVRWPQSAQLLDIDGLGAADARHRPDPGRGMYAEGCAPDHPFAQAKVEQQLGQTWHERDDACRGRGYGAVLGADCIQCSIDGIIEDLKCRVLLTPCLYDGWGEFS